MYKLITALTLISFSLLFFNYDNVISNTVLSNYSSNTSEDIKTISIKPLIPPSDNHLANNKSNEINDLNHVVESNPIDEQIRVWEDLENNKDRIGFELIQEYDKDDNGLLSHNELSAHIDYFNSMDLDSDGYLDKNEVLERVYVSKSTRLKAIEEERDFIINFFSSLDKNKDLNISTDEIPNTDSFLNEYDQDNDGYISPDEQAIVLSRIAPKKIIAYLSE